MTVSTSGLKHLVREVTALREYCGTCQSNILMNIKSQDFPAEHYPECHTASCLCVHGKMFQQWTGVIMDPLTGLWCSVGSDHIGQPSLPMWIQLSFLVLWSVLTAAHQEHLTPCCSGDTLTQSSNHQNLILVKVAQILTLVFSCFQHIDLKNWLFTCCLIYLTLWQMQL